MSQMMETDEALDPIAIRSFRPKAVMLQPEDITRLIEQLFWACSPKPPAVQMPEPCVRF
jgi:hypothetical protein